MRDDIYPGARWWWKCLNCGERVDGAILLNRAEQELAEARQRESMERDLKEWSEWMAKVPLAPLVSIP